MLNAKEAGRLKTTNSQQNMNSNSTDMEKKYVTTDTRLECETQV